MESGRPVLPGMVRWSSMELISQIDDADDVERDKAQVLHTKKLIKISI